MTLVMYSFYLDEVVIVEKLDYSDSWFADNGTRVIEVRGSYGIEEWLDDAHCWEFIGTL